MDSLMQCTCTICAYAKTIQFRSEYFAFGIKRIRNCFWTSVLKHSLIHSLLTFSNNSRKNEGKKLDTAISQLGTLKWFLSSGVLLRFEFHALHQILYTQFWPPFKNDPYVAFIYLTKLYIPSTPNNSNETHTFMCVGRTGRFGQR